MAHIIGLTLTGGMQVMVNADHILYWAPINIDKPGWEDVKLGSAVHLTGGTVLKVLEDIHTINERIDVIQAALETWMDEE